MKKVNKKIKKKSSIAFAKLSQPLKLYANAVSGAKPAFTHNTDSYRYQARGHFFGPPRFESRYIKDSLYKFFPNNCD
jgi:hypothetical protein